MAAIGISKPTFKTSGVQKEPYRASYPVGANALFDEGDFVVISPQNAPPEYNNTQLPAPSIADAYGSTAAGTFGAGTYYLVLSYLNANGETMATATPQQITLTGGTNEIIVPSPPPMGDATGYRAYVGTVVGTYHLQGATTAIGTTLTLSAAYSAAGAAPQATNGTGLAAPSAPTLGASGTAGPAARTEYYVITYVTDIGETVASAEASIALTAGQIVTVTSPAVSGNAYGYNVYAATASGIEQKQNATPINIGTNWVEPSTGLVVPGVQRAVANQPAQSLGLPVIAGLADHDYNAVYGGYVGGAQPGGLTPFGRPAWNTRRYGATEQYIGISTEPTNAHVISAGGIDFAINLASTIVWDPGMLFQQVGLNIDSGSGFFVADPTLSNKVATIVGTVDGPNWGGPGDTGKRILIRFLATAAVPV